MRSSVAGASCKSFQDKENSNVWGKREFFNRQGFGMNAIVLTAFLFLPVGSIASARSNMIGSAVADSLALQPQTPAKSFVKSPFAPLHRVGPKKDGAIVEIDAGESLPAGNIGDSNILREGGAHSRRVSV
jgi:hypothetical protein